MISSIAASCMAKLMVLASVLNPVAMAAEWSGEGAVGGSAASSFSIGQFLTSGANNLQFWGGIIIVILGVVAVIVAVFKLVTGLISHGKKETNWVVVIILFLVGGICIYGGWNLVAGTIARGMQQTAQQWGSSDTLSTSFVLPVTMWLGL